MASEILSLFGGQTPQQLRGAALDSMLISPTQMGSQGLLQQVVSMGQNAGTMIGMGAGQLMGGKVAGEVEAAYLEDAIEAGKAGKTPAEKMKLVAAALEGKPGMGAQYMKALTEARRLEAEDFTMAQAKEKARLRTVKRQVDTFDPITGKPIGQRTADITQYDTGERDEKGNIIWADLDGQDGTTKGTGAPPPPPTAAAQAKAELERLKAAEKGRTASTTVAGRIDTATEKASMEPLVAEANIERAGYNSAEQQVQAEEKKLRDMASVQNLPPEVIKYLEVEDARMILRDRFAYLNDAQKRELRKRIAQGGMAQRAPRRQPPAPKGDISGSRLL